MREECQIELSVYADVEVLLCMHIYPRIVTCNKGKQTYFVFLPNNRKYSKQS